jgi:hypothetical protein
LIRHQPEDKGKESAKPLESENTTKAESSKYLVKPILDSPRFVKEEELEELEDTFMKPESEKS